MKTYSESRIELRNLQILKKTVKSQVSFCHQSSAESRKSSDVALNIAGVEGYPRKTCGCGQPRGHLIRALSERSVNDGGDFCLLRLAILKSV